MNKINLSKRTLTQLIRFDCDRLLKNMMTPEKKGVSPGKDRPGIETIQDIGHEWEREQFNQLIEVFGASDEIKFSYNKKENKFEEVDLIKILKNTKVPQLIIEASFRFLPIFKNINYEIFEFDGARPDIIWITDNGEKKILNIIDIKTAAEPSLKHFSEVVLYALSLDALIRNEKLNDIFEVNLECGYIWPGTHDVDLFIKTFNSYKNRKSDSALKDSLYDILIPIKLELYYEHVKSFFEERLPTVYAQDYDTVRWFMNKGCSLCDYRKECSEECDSSRLIYQIYGISKGQADTLTKSGIKTLDDIQDNEVSWDRAILNNVTLKPNMETIKTKAKAIIYDSIIPISDRKTYLMPSWSNIHVFIEIHFDPITGLTYAIGMKKKYFDQSNSKFISEQSSVLINDKAGVSERIFENSSEKNVFIDFLKSINSIIESAISNKQSVHFYFWDSLEVKQLKRMMTRYLSNEKVVGELEKLLQFYAPEGKLENPDIFATIPGTVVKDTLNYLLALPLKYDYSLIDSANAISRLTDRKFEYVIHKHFYTEMNDQIPFERAYDLWTNQVRIFNPNTGKKYTREEVRERLKVTVDTRLKALESIVSYMQQNYKKNLLLIKKPIDKLKPTKKRGMDPITNELYMFESLNNISRDIENKQLRLLPVDEKEAKFVSMRGLRLLKREDFIDDLTKIRENPKYFDKPLKYFYVFSIPDSSLDAKINEGSFMLVLSNENNPQDDSEPQLNTDYSVAHYLGGYDATKELAERHGLSNLEYVPRVALKSLLQVTLVKIEVCASSSYIVVMANDYYGDTIDFGFETGLLNKERPFVIDPVYKDFNMKDYSTILKIIGKSDDVKPKVKK